MAPEVWHAVLAVGDGETGWPELHLGWSRKQLVQMDAYKAISYHFLSLSTAEIAGYGVIQCSAWPRFLPDVPAAWQSLCGLAVDDASC